ncbi:hypothetical protein ACP4OV_019179 [Aristida adscensionis]
MASQFARRNKRACRHAAPPAATAAAAAAAVNDGPLPTELLSEILLWLPAKALCRLRLVCRAWRALTSEPHFAGIHASRHRRPLVAGLCKRRGEVQFVDLSGDVVKRMPVQDPRVRSSRHNASVQADLVCISDGHGNARVLTAATGGAAALPACPATRGVPVMSTSVLGQVPSTGEHKLLRTLLYCKDGTFRQMCDVITVTARGGAGGDGRWRARPCPPVFVSGASQRRAVVHGVAYFLSLTLLLIMAMTMP